MITAIPMNEDRIANHFTKAENILFINEQGEEVSRHANPVLRANCASKKDLLNLLIQQRAERIVVRNIGRQMLGKLLSHQLAVFQTHCGRRNTAELTNPEAIGLVSLTGAEQGRPSLNHEAKEKEGGCRHNKEATSKQGRRCQQRTNGHAVQEHDYHECHRQNGHSHGRGHGRCGDAKPRGHRCCRNTPA
ncbi:hypothetical protein MD588_06650 [Photobacterium sp. SDRW27]|uniref:NifB/NifX family molybdenum-iron cluster-binding protein n=1 Tax=Photobacterium obscurum TaxID=2829490 RepID=UPI0022444671|nr:NifB/NifX family molybdenum-iron cluster-binding protein [Photobacterium obscurum]MCW8328486.1 hypothetical protein [Photobacterium obscurum]